MTGPVFKSQVASSTPFDNSGTDLTSTDTEAAIKEVSNKIVTSASPGFSFGRTGVCNAGTYMQCETVPSNISGRWVYINSAKVITVFVSNELTTTYSMTATYHDGNGVNEVVLGTVTVTSAKGSAITVDWSVPVNKQIAIKVADISANSPKNVVVGLQLQGTN